MSSRRRHASIGAASGGATRHLGVRGTRHPRHSHHGAFSEHAPDVRDRRLPAARLAREHRVDFGTGVVEVADSLTWLKGRHTLKLGFDLRWARLNVVQPPSPTGTFTFSSLFSDQPGVANSGAPLASFLLGQVQAFSIDVQHERDPGTRARPGVLRAGRLEGVRPGDASIPGCAIR